MAKRKKSSVVRKKRVSTKSQRRKSIKKTVRGKVRHTLKKERKDILGMQQSVIEQAKFYAAPTPLAQPRITEELPSGYGRDRIVLQVRDPWWCHAYWEITTDTWDKLRKELKDTFYHSKRILRVYDVSYIIFNGRNAHRFFDIQVNEHADNWYIDTGGPGRSWCVDFGLLLTDGRFITIVRSNTVSTPIEGPSGVTDEEWMIPEDLFARLYGIGVGLGSSPVKIKKLWEQRFAVSSPTKLK